MSTTIHKTTQRIRRHARIRARVTGTAERPRLSVFRSNRFLYAQIIDDAKSVTLIGSDTRSVEGKTAMDRARALGTFMATEAQKKGIATVVFDRGGFLYTGAVRELAEAARAQGLTF